MEEKQNTVFMEEAKGIQQIRKGKLSIGRLQFATPFMLSEVKSPADLQYVVDWMGRFDAENLQGIVAPLYDSKRILLALNTNMGGQRQFGGDPVSNPYANIKQTKLVLLDPKLELAIPTVSHEVTMPGNLPERYLSMIRNKKDRKDVYKIYSDFLDFIDRNTPSYVSSMLIAQISNGATVLLAPSNLIVNEESRTLDLSIKVNRATAQISKLNEGWTYSYYFLLRVSDFEDDEIYKRIIEVIAKDRPPLVFFKVIDIEYLDSRNAMVQRTNLKKFLKDLRLLTKSSSISTFFLNLDALGLFLTYCGIDGFSTPVDGMISTRAYNGMKNRNLSQEFKGRYFLYKLMAFIPYRALIKMRKELKAIPCPNGCCDAYNEYDLSKLSRLTKARFCRLHYLNTMNAYLTEIHKGIEQDNIRAFENKLLDSACINYHDMLPTELTPIPQA